MHVLITLSAKTYVTGFGKTRHLRTRYILFNSYKAIHCTIHSYVADFTTTLDCFLSTPQALIYIGVEDGLQQSSVIIWAIWPRIRPHGTQNVTNIAKAMAYIMKKSGGDSQQGGCLYKPTSGIQ